MEIKEVCSEWEGKANLEVLPNIYNTLEYLDTVFVKIEERCIADGLDGISYTSKKADCQKLTIDMGIFNTYIGELVGQIQEELDTPFYKDVNKNAMESLENLSKREYSVDNTLGVKEYVISAKDGVDVSHYASKSSLTFDDFMGLAINTGTGESQLKVPNALGMFTNIYKTEYKMLKEEYKEIGSLEDYLKSVRTLGQYDHKIDNPVKEFLSILGSVTVVIPIFNAVTGKDLITGEVLSDFERGLNVVYAAVGAVTFGSAGLAVKGGIETVKTVGKVLVIELASNTASYGVAKVGEALDLPPGITLMLSLVAGLGVSTAGTKTLFTNPSTGKVVYEIDESLDAFITGNKGASGAIDDIPKARFGDRKISNELYNEIRSQTPTPEIRKFVNKDVKLPMDDFAIPGKTISKNLEADHIVSMDRIAKMEGFDKLSKSQQLEILNYDENFIGLSKSANTSKGSKTYEAWEIYKKENIPINPVFREEMILKEKILEGKIQQMIDNGLK